MNIIGICGTDASGKDTVGRTLAENHNWLFLSVTDLLRDEAKKRALVLERPSLRAISAEWRRENGLAVLVEKALQEFEPQKGKYQGLIIASLRHPAEADKVHELGGKVVWVDADPRLRYERIIKRDRGSEDHISFVEFLAEEQAQMSFSGDEATLNLAGVKEKADIFIENNSNDIEAFKDQVEKALGIAEKL